jgi:hypothetical protein
MIDTLSAKYELYSDIIEPIQSSIFDIMNALKLLQLSHQRSLIPFDFLQHLIRALLRFPCVDFVELSTLLVSDECMNVLSDSNLRFLMESDRERLLSLLLRIALYCG